MSAHQISSLITISSFIIPRSLSTYPPPPSTPPSSLVAVPAKAIWQERGVTRGKEYYCGGKKYNTDMGEGSRGMGFLCPLGIFLQVT